MLSSETKQPRFSVYQGTINFYKSGYGVDSDVVYFFIPENLSDESNFMVRNLKSGTTQWLLENPVTLFDADNIGKVSCVVEYGSTFSKTVDAEQTERLMIVSEVVKTTNEEGEVVTCLTGVRITNGSEIELMMADDSVDAGITLNPGDIIGWNANNKGSAIAIRKVMSVPNPDGTLQDADSTTAVINQAYYTTENANERITDPNKAITYEEDSLIYATPIQADGKFWKWRGDAASKDFYMQGTSSVKTVLVFDGSLKTNMVKKTSISDIRTKELFGDKADKILILIDEYRAASCVIYRNWN